MKEKFIIIENIVDVDSCLKHKSDTDKEAIEELQG